jgi:hypothetical protein
VQAYNLIFSKRIHACWNRWNELSPDSTNSRALATEQSNWAAARRYDKIIWWCRVEPKDNTRDNWNSLATCGWGFRRHVVGCIRYWRYVSQLTYPHGGTNVYRAVTVVCMCTPLVHAVCGAFATSHRTPSSNDQRSTAEHSGTAGARSPGCVDEGGCGVLNCRLLDGVCSGLYVGIVNRSIWLYNEHNTRFFFF